MISALLPRGVAAAAAALTLVLAVPSLAQAAPDCVRRDFSDMRAGLSPEDTATCGRKFIERASAYWQTVYGAEKVFLLPVRPDGRVPDFASPADILDLSRDAALPADVRADYGRGLVRADALYKAGFFTLSADVQRRLVERPAGARAWRDRRRAGVNSLEDPDLADIKAYEVLAVERFFDRYDALLTTPDDPKAAAEDLHLRGAIFKFPLFSPGEAEQCKVIGRRSAAAPGIEPGLRQRCLNTGEVAGRVQAGVAKISEDILRDGHLEILLRSALLSGADGPDGQVPWNGFERDELQLMLQSMLNDMPPDLPPRALALARQTRWTVDLTVPKRSGEDFFFMYTVPVGDEITLHAAPNLVRAAFAWCYAPVRILGRPLETPPTLRRSMLSDTEPPPAEADRSANPFPVVMLGPSSGGPPHASRPDLLAIADQLRDCTREMFGFALGHELGHVLLSPKADAAVSEEDCDCFARRLAAQGRISTSLGLFQTYLAAAVKQALPELWTGEDIAAQQRLAERFRRGPCPEPVLRL